MRKPLHIVLMGVLAACLQCSPTDETGEAKPNVLFICIDDLRPELGCYGVQEIHTPHIDRLAAQGILFSRNYCQTAACAPSRASMWTGLRPDSLKVWHLGDRFREINPSVVTMPQYFQAHGYHTVSIGKIFHNHMPDSVSFEEPDLRPEAYKTKDMVDRDAESFYYDETIKQELAEVRAQRLKRNPRAYAGGWAYGRSTECSEAPDSAFYDGAQTDLAISTLKRLKSAGQPFFLALGYYRPHLPFVAPKKYWDLYDRDSISLAGNPFLPVNSPIMAMNSTYELTGCYDLEYVRHPSKFQLSEDTARLLKHGYYASVSYVDACLGKVLASLEDLGLADNTIVVVWGDHGWKLGDHGSWCKQSNYLVDTHVPLIIRAPAQHNNGQVNTEITESIDIFPTLCDLAHLPVPDILGGKSMLPLMQNQDSHWESTAFTQFHRRPRVSPDGLRYMGYSMITENYHLVEWHEWNNNKKIAGKRMATELYDLRNDPMENQNVAGDAAYVEIVESLSARLNNDWPANRPLVETGGIPVLEMTD